MAEKTFHSITLPGQDTARVPLTAAEFSTSVAYQVKDYCTYQGKLYRCTTAHAAGAWNAAHFTATDVDAEFDRKLDIPASQASAPANPRVGDLWIDNDENSPIYNVDASPTLNSTNAVQSGGTRVALNSLDSRKMEHGVITGDFSASVDYRIGDLVFYATTANGITTRTLYRCTTDHNAAAWNAAHFTATTLEVELQKIRESGADTDMIGDLFGARTTYAVGDYCIYNDNLYRCIQAVDNTGVTTPAFDPDDWTQVALANDVSDLNSALNSIQDDLYDVKLDLYKEHNATDNCYVTSSGSTVTDLDYMISDHIPFESGTVTWQHGKDMNTDAKLVIYNAVGTKYDFFTPDNTNGYITNSWTNTAGRYLVISIKKENAQETKVINNGKVIYEYPYVGSDKGALDSIADLESVVSSIDNSIEEINEEIYAVDNATFGYWLKSDGTMEAQEGYCVSDKIQLSDISTSIVWTYGSGMATDAKLVLYNSSDAKLDYYSPYANSTSREVSGLHANTAYIRASFKIVNSSVSSITQGTTVLYEKPHEGKNGILEQIKQLSNSPFKLKVMSLNVRSYEGKGNGNVSEFPGGPDNAEEYNETLRRFRGLLNKYNPDVLILCEDKITVPYNTTNVYDVIYKHYFPYKVQNTNQNRAAPNIYSKYPLKDFGFLLPTYTPSTVENYRYITYIEISINNNKIFVLGMLPRGGGSQYYESDRLPYLQKAVSFLSDKKYGICAGDFNAESATPSDEIAIWQTNGYQIGNMDYFGTFNTYPVPNPSKPLDNQVCKGMTLGRFVVDDSEYSDHLCIIGEFNIR